MDAFSIFSTVYGLGNKSIESLISRGARTIDDLKYNPEFRKSLTNSSKTYLRYYDDLQERIPRDEVALHYETIAGILNFGGDFFKVDIVGSYRRGAESCGDVDVLFTTTSANQYDPNIDYIRFAAGMLHSRKYLLEVLKGGTRVLNAISRLKTPGDMKARRVDLFFSPPDLYSFALLAKTGDVHFNKSLRSRVREKYPECTLSELGFSNGVGGDLSQYQTEESILRFIGINKKILPREMIGYAESPASTVSPLTRITFRKRGKKRSRDRSRSQSQSRSTSSSKSRKRRRKEQQQHMRISSSQVSPLTSEPSYDSEATYE